MTRPRKTNLPSNPYAGEAATALRLQDRKGWPFPAPRKPSSQKPEPPAGMRAMVLALAIVGVAMWKGAA